jgi:indolepyruvate ferredoxin oxidoreductase
LTVLRAGRHVRGTPFDVAGWSKLRRIERKLPVEYAAMMTRLVRESTVDAVVLEIANLPDMIRGYEHIKLANLAAYRERLAELLPLT